jgi:transposase
MQFVPLKSVPEQAALMTHRARQLLVEQRTRLGNSIRGQMAEMGIIARQGQAGFAALLAIIDHPEEGPLPAEARPILQVLVAQWRSLGPQIAALEQQIIAWHKSNPDSLRLATIPQFGPLVSSALLATAGDAKRFNSGRQFAAWIGLVPRQNSTGGKERLGGITKAGDRYLRQLLVVAATGLIHRARANPQLSPWFAGLLARMPARKATVALANKMARVAWALLAKQTTYRAPAPIAPAQAA